MIFLVFSLAIVAILYFMVNISTKQNRQNQQIIYRVEELEKKINVLIVDKNDKAS